MECIDQLVDYFKDRDGNESEISLLETVLKSSQKSCPS